MTPNTDTYTYTTTLDSVAVYACPRDLFLFAPFLIQFPCESMLFFGVSRTNVMLNLQNLALMQSHLHSHPLALNKSNQSS